MNDAYLKGWFKKAAEAGFTEGQAIDLLKEAGLFDGVGAQGLKKVNSGNVNTALKAVDGFGSKWNPLDMAARGIGRAAVKGAVPASGINLPQVK